MANINITKTNRYVCNFCNKHGEYEVKNDGIIMFVLCKNCYKQLTEKLTVSQPKE